MGRGGKRRCEGLLSVKLMACGRVILVVIDEHMDVLLVLLGSLILHILLQLLFTLSFLSLLSALVSIRLLFCRRFSPPLAFLCGGFAGVVLLVSALLLSLPGALALILKIKVDLPFLFLFLFVRAILLGDFVLVLAKFPLLT